MASSSRISESFTGKAVFTRIARIGTNKKTDANYSRQLAKFA